jgi:hypothetical protein
MDNSKGEELMGLDMWLYRKDVDEVAYWRKENAIHNWFITNYANGVDDCNSIEVDRVGLVVLRDICLQVSQAGNAELAMELLPPVAGFFFGSSQIDDWYWEGVKDTADKLTAIIDETSEDQMFEYQASW